MKHPTLYKRTSNGKIEQWSVWVEGADVVSEYGHVGGAMQTARETAVGKNIGRANETTPPEQAKLQAESDWNTKKTRKGYVEDIAKAEAGENSGAGGIRPMLAQTFTKHGDKIEFPCYAQPKLDGIRCIAVVDDDRKVTLWSREQKPIVAVPRIAKAVEALGLPPGAVLDGELYRHVAPEPSVEVELSKGLKALVSEEDAEEVLKHKWSASAGGYAVRATPRSEGKEIIYMHRQITDAPDGIDVDHVNGNKLDNRRTNLRLCTVSQNLANSKVRIQSQSGLKGVYFYRRDNNWQAQITVNYKKVHLGYFNTPEEAASAYDNAARKYFGEFARTNVNREGDFEKISSCVRKQYAASDAEQALIEYHVYDLPSTQPFGKRSARLREIIPMKGPLKFVGTQFIAGRDDLLDYFEQCRANGYEGAMARNDAPYEEGKRSYGLQKLKEFEDADFDIIGVEEGVGKMQGLAIFVCTTGKEEFRCKMEGALDGLRKYLTNKKLWEGKKLTVQFQGLTGKNKLPRFPVGKSVRDYE